MRNTIELINCLVNLSGDISGEILNIAISTTLLIGTILGVIFFVVGFVRLVLAHAKNDIEGQKRAGWMSAAGFGSLCICMIGQVIMKLFL